MPRHQSTSLQLLFRLVLLFWSVCLFESSDDNPRHSRRATLKMIDGTWEESRLFLERCSQSSQSESCQLAIDDDINQESWSNECSFTTADIRPWFEARLENPAFVTKVQIFNILNVEERGADALKDFDLIVGRLTCLRYRSYSSFGNMTLACDTYADHIRIQSHLNHAVLNLCEVVVYGKALIFDRKDNGNTRLGYKICSQSSAADDKQLCHLALDDNLSQDFKRDRSCFLSQKERSPWWEVLLKVPSIVRTVRIYNRVDCCQNMLNSFEIFVSRQLCYRHDQNEYFSIKEFGCGRFGDRVRITGTITGDQNELPLCEVMLYGFPAVYHGIKKPKYIGCFPERKLKRDLGDLGGLYRMSSEKCDRICQRKHKPYFGLQQGQQCWCGDRYGSYGRAHDESCWMRCDGSSEMTSCGAKLISSVFETGRPTVSGNTSSSTPPEGAAADST